MPRVLLTTGCPYWPFVRQTPGRLGIWEDFEFVIDQTDVECDAWVTFDNPSQEVRATCAADNMFFVTAEPPEIRTYRGDFLSQFRWVVTCHDIRHRGLIRAQQSHPWHVGVDYDNEFEPVLDYDSLSNMPFPDKRHLISTVISNKAITVAHRQRLEFVNRLKQRLGDAFHVLGIGHEPIADKWQAVAPYRFHLVMENAVRPQWITEKISDAFLGSAFPLYFGAPDLADHVPPRSFEPIDIFRPNHAVNKICAAIDKQLDAERREEVEEARRIVLDELNLFPMLVRLLRERMIDAPRQTIRLYPKSHHVRIVVGGIGRYLRRSA